jgi:hypothetical protein
VSGGKWESLERKVRRVAKVGELWIKLRYLILDFTILQL